MVEDETPVDPGTILRKAATAALGVVILAAAGWVVVQLVAQLAFVVVPFGIAVLLAALLTPGRRWLQGRGVPRLPASVLVLLGGLAVVGGMVVFVVRALADGLPELVAQAGEGYQRLRDWVVETAGVSPERLDRLADEVGGWAAGRRESLVAGVWGAFSTIGTVLTGVVLTLFIAAVLVHDGGRMWRRATRRLPDDRLQRAGAQVFADLGAYVRATIVVALIDAVGIGLGLWVVGVPLVVPLSAVVFLGGFVPLVGAFVSGLLAAVVALVAVGPAGAAIVVVVVVVVQQLEGNLLEPLITGGAVRLHPLVIVLAVATGAHLAGIVGAVLAVPVVMALRTAARAFLP